MDGQLGKRYLKGFLEKTDQLLEGYLAEKVEEARKIGAVPAELLERFSAYGRRGKRIRGSLVTLGYRAAGGRDEAAIFDAGLAMELFHAALLAQDDVMDADDRRRGLATIHRQLEARGRELGVRGSARRYGESLAVAVSDVGFYLSWEKLLGSAFPPERIIAAGKLYSRYAVNTAHGQTLDLTTTGTEGISEGDALNVLRYKSAEYTGVLPLSLGAVLGGMRQGSGRFKHLQAYALAFGWAFQIQDDLLGTFGDDKQTGKPNDSDLKTGKNTLLVLHLIKHGTAAQKAVLHRVLGNQQATDAQVEVMRRAFQEAGSYQQVVELGLRYVKEGKKHIGKITDDPEVRQILESLLVYTMERVV